MVQTYQDNATDAHGGDRAFEGQLVGQLPYLNRLALALCHNHEQAKDLAQETAAKAWRGRQAFETGSNFRAWLFTILRNEFRSDCRRSWRQIPWDQQVAEQRLIVNDAQSSAMELLDVVRAMTKLPPHQRDAIVMVAAHGMSHEKAASISLCAVGTIKSRVSRARKALQGAIDIGTRPTRGAHPAMSLAAFAAAQHAGSATSAGPQLL